jgi:hypothetical protein
MSRTRQPAKSAAVKRGPTSDSDLARAHWLHSALIVFNGGEFTLGAAAMLPCYIDHPPVPAFGSRAVH